MDTLFWEVLLSVTRQVGLLQGADINLWKEMGHHPIHPGQYNRASILSHFLLMTWASALDTLPSNFCYKSSLTQAPRYPFELHKPAPQMKQKENNKVSEEMVYESCMNPKSRSAVKQLHDNTHDNNSRYAVLA